MIGNLKLKRFEEVNLVLSGGAAKGIAHIGVLKALEELGIKVKRLSGVSAGAIVSVFYASGYTPDEMLKLLKEVNWLKLFKFKTPKMGLMGWEKAAEFLEKELGVKRLEDLNIPTYLCSADLYTGKALYFGRGDLIPVLLGSCSIPGIFEPVEYENFLLVDGGIVNNLPVEPLEKFKEPIIGVDVLPITQERKIKNILHILIRSFFLAVRSNSEKRKEFCNVVIEPPLEEFSPLDVNKADEIFLRGYESTLRIMRNFVKH